MNRIHSSQPQESLGVIKIIYVLLMRNQNRQDHTLVIWLSANPKENVLECTEMYCLHKEGPRCIQEPVPVYQFNTVIEILLFLHGHRMATFQPSEGTRGRTESDAESEKQKTW